MLHESPLISGLSVLFLERSCFEWKSNKVARHNSHKDSIVKEDSKEEDDSEGHRVYGNERWCGEGMKKYIQELE